VLLHHQLSVRFLESGMLDHFIGESAPLELLQPARQGHWPI
jgi:hypothetical protein